MSGSAGRYSSPLRYPGGKAKVANYIKLIMLENELLGREYVEPYAGGASVALSLLFEEYAEHVHINDINSGIYAFWDAALNHTEELCERVLSTPVTVAEWLRQREVHRDPQSSGVELGFATFYLNRTNRSGIISGGVIGGLQQTGPWKIDARYNAPELVSRIRKIGRFRSRITLTHRDAAALLRAWSRPGAPPAFFYLDPPYYVKGGDLYDHSYSHGDHQQISQLVSALPHPWLVSYDAAPEIIAMYADSPSNRYDLGYSAAQRVSGSEVMFRSSELDWPEEAPAGVSGRRVDLARSHALPI